MHRNLFLEQLHYRIKNTNCSKHASFMGISIIMLQFAAFPANHRNDLEFIATLQCFHGANYLWLQDFPVRRRQSRTAGSHPGHSLDP